MAVAELSGTISPKTAMWTGRRNQKQVQIDGKALTLCWAPGFEE